VAECFCGCGRRVHLGRPLAWNKAAQLVRTQRDRLRLAENSDLSTDDRSAFEATVTLGTRALETLRALLHGEVERRDVRAQLKADLASFNDSARRMLSPGGLAAPDLALAGIGLLGGRAWELNELWQHGRHAPGEIVDLADTLTTINEDPVVKVTIEVRPEGEPTFRIVHKQTFSRVEPPRRGERVDVAYDPDDHSRFTFRRPDLTDDAARTNAQPAASDPLRQLEELAELRSRGVLTEEEFAEQKAKLLERL
jgi:hypothetical protein